MTAGPGENNRIDIQQDDSGAGKVVVYEGGSGGVPIAGPCDALGNAQVCPVNPPGVRVDLGDGDDWGDISMGLPAGLHVVMSGGTGNDRLQGNVQAATLDGGAGDDSGAGDDLLSGDGNRDAAPDVIDGGPGADRMEDDWEGPRGLPGRPAEHGDRRRRR